MRRILPLVWLIVVLLPSALAACRADTASPTPPGEKVQTAYGAFRTVKPEQLKAMLADKDFMLVNVNVPYQGEIEKTNAFVPYDLIDRRIKQYALDQNTKIVLYSQTGEQSRYAAEKLVRLGYSNVWMLSGGMEAWQQAGYPLKSAP